MNKAPTTLIIMDGFGLTDPGPGNAVSLAQTPQLDRLFAEYAHTTLSASGLDVGLPAGQMGNSEVGHTNIGGGRVVFQDLPRISRAIDDGSFFENAAYNKAMDDCLEKGSSLHLYGLLSDGGVHSHIQHLYALLQMARNKGLTRVYVHAFLDGRDVSPTSGKGFVADCQEKCRALGVGKIATVMGRYYAMDRDNRWERVQLAYDAMVYGEGIQNPDPVDAVAQSYENDVTDEFMEPVVCDPDGTISDNDSIIFFNFRPDRAREITRAIVDPEFDGFQREFFPTTYVCNTEYDASMPNVLVAWPRIPVKNGLGEYLSAMGMTQLRIAETEKYAHVTFFFNGGVEKQYPGEDRVLVPSPKVATYDLQPEMSAYEVCDKCIERINSGAYDVIILNFANCDMVGHTGVLQAAVKAVETVDTCVGRVVEATLKMGGIAMVTADHGNAEVMPEQQAQPLARQDHLQQLSAAHAFERILREKDHGNTVIARFRECFPRLPRRFFKKSMWNLRHNADAITGDAVSVLAGAVFKLFDDLQRVVYCPMRSLSADIDNGADSAGIMLAFLFGESMLMCLFHAFLSPLPL